MNKKESHKIIFQAIEDCKGKTITQIQGLIKDGNELYNSIVNQIIATRLSELNYTDGTGALYI